MTEKPWTQSLASVQSPSLSQAITEPQRWALGLIVVFVSGKLLLHFLTTALTAYGIHRDEFLYLAMGQHLQFWEMDFPPFIAVLANASRWLFGDTLFAIRFSPTLAGACVVALAGLLTREFGGGRFAQGLAMCSLVASGLFLRPSSLFQPVVFDQLWWTLGFFALVKIIQRAESRWWWILGLAGGLGLLTKFSIGFFVLGVAVGLLLTPERKVLATRWPYLALLVALLVGSASIVGQFRLDFPVIMHMADLRSEQLSRVTYGEFVGGQFKMLGPLFLVVLAGVWALFWGRLLRVFRPLGWACLSAFLLLLFLHGKPYYLGPIYPMLFAAGAATLEGFPGKPLRIAVICLWILIIAGGVFSLPMGLPILPAPQMARYVAAFAGKDAVTTNRKEVLPLPQDYADMLGWEEQVAAVAQVYKSLPPAKRTNAVLLARNYGEAGALEFFGPRFGLPPKITGLSHPMLWPLPPPGGSNTVVALGIPPEALEQYFSSVKVAYRFDHPWMVTEERNVPICIAENPRADVKPWKPRTWRKQI